MQLHTKCADVPWSKDGLHLAACEFPAATRRQAECIHSDRLLFLPAAFILSQTNYNYYTDSIKQKKQPSCRRAVPLKTSTQRPEIPLLTPE